MSPSDKATYDDSLLIKYLVGSLPESDAERLDELSVSDQELAMRLEAIENDLVDSWARGELSGETLERFNRTYLSSPERKNKLRFAQALVAHQARAATATSSRAGSALQRERSTSMWSQNFATRQFGRWAFAMVVLLALLGSAYLAVDNSRLRRQLAQEAAQRKALESRQREVSRELATEGVSNGVNNESQEPGALPSSSSSQQNLLSVILLPAMRGVSPITTISMPAHSERVLMRLQLEANDFPEYRVALRDASLGQVIWRSQNLHSSPEAGKTIVSAIVPSSLLKAHNYVMELAGVRAQREELMATYPFRVLN
jgi:hypothetical protein